MNIIGIDLGTTNSLVACYEDGRAVLIPDETGDVLLPSAVFFDEKERTLLVGREAKERGRELPDFAASSFKRAMGTEHRFFLGQKSFLAPELSAQVLTRLKFRAEQYLGAPIDEAIITVPAYFNDKQRADTKKAAALAGLTVERLINEPSAAALAYRNLITDDDDERDLNLIVFDFGGGTLDLSYVECYENIIEIIAVAGDNQLGGDDIDRAIAAYVCTENGTAWEKLSVTQQAALLKNAEAAKCALSMQQETAVSLEGFSDVALNEEVLFSICMPLFSRIRKLFLQLLQDAQMRISDIDDLVMVGGSSGSGVVQRFLTELLGKAPIVPAQTDQVVAHGAGVYAGIRARGADVRDLLLTDVCPFSLGISTGEHDVMSAIIPRNTTLPVHCVEHYVTMRNFQDAISVRIYQGEEYYAKDNLFLGEFTIAVPPAQKGMEGVDVHFTYDINGILHVEAVNSKNEHRELFIENQTLSEREKAHYRKLMETFELPVAEHPETKRMLERLQSCYRESHGERSNYVGFLLDAFVRAVSSGRRAQVRRMIRELDAILGSDLFSEENLEAEYFDGELKQRFEMEFEDDFEDDDDFEGVDEDECEDAGAREAAVSGSDGIETEER